jgi:hypothetical protein
MYLELREVEKQKVPFICFKQEIDKKPSGPGCIGRYVANHHWYFMLYSADSVHEPPSSEEVKAPNQIPIPKTETQLMTRLNDVIVNKRFT